MSTEPLDPERAYYYNTRTGEVEQGYASSWSDRMGPYATRAEAEVATTGGLSPRVAPMGEIRDLGGLLQRAGFALPVTDVDRVMVRYDSAFSLMADLRRMGATNVLIERRRMPTRRATMLRMAQIYSERFADPDGRIRATFDVIWLSGWAPHESQQKPLKPGSAKVSLEAAVKKAKRD